MTDNLIKKGFWLAGLSNIFGVLICSKALTNDGMLDAQPAVMGYFGLISIILWGLAYISVSKTYDQVKCLVGVFVVEKLAYVAAWLSFITSQSLDSVYQQDFLAGVFYTIYGANDFIFMLFFTFVFLKGSQAKS